MVTETLETQTSTETQVDQSQSETQTETTQEETKETSTEERAAETQAGDAATQVQVTEPEKPDYMTRADWEREKAEVAQRAAANALEADRRRRQTENARKAKAEQDRAERRNRALDTVKASFGARGIYQVPDEAVVTAISRVAQDEAEAMTAENAALLGDAFDYVAAPAFNKEGDWDERYEPIVKMLAPRMQALVNQIKPAIEAEARKGYIAESELPARVEAEIARRNAQARANGPDDLNRPEGQPLSTIDRSWEAVTSRIISNDADAKDKEMWESRFGRKT